MAALPAGTPDRTAAAQGGGEAPRVLPTSLTTSWSRRGALPRFTSAKSLQISSMRTKRPTALENMHGQLLVCEVKLAFAKEVQLNARKAIVLRWYGDELDDSLTLDACRVPDGATLEATFRQRTEAEIEAMRAV